MSIQTVDSDWTGIKNALKTTAEGVIGYEVLDNKNEACRRTRTTRTKKEN